MLKLHEDVSTKTDKELLQEVRSDIKKAREFAGERLQAKEGLVMVVKLEEIMRKISTH